MTNVMCIVLTTETCLISIIVRTGIDYVLQYVFSKLVHCYSSVHCCYCMLDALPWLAPLHSPPSLMDISSPNLLKPSTSTQTGLQTGSHNSHSCPYKFRALVILLVINFRAITNHILSKWSFSAHL